MDNYKIIDCEQFGTQDIESLLNSNVEKYPDFEFHSLQAITVYDGPCDPGRKTTVAIFKLKESK